MSIKVSVVPVTAYQQNCSILKCETTGRAAIVDPGGDTGRILAAVKEMGAEVEKILLTHGHMDHCAASEELRTSLGIPIEGPHRDDAFWIDTFWQFAQKFFTSLFKLLRIGRAHNRIDSAGFCF